MGTGHNFDPNWYRIPHYMNKMKHHFVEQQGVCRIVWALQIYIKKYLKAKEELWKLKYVIMQKYNLQKIL